MANEIEQLDNLINQLIKKVEQLKNINLLSKETFDSIESPPLNELYAVETPTVVETYSDDDGNWYRVYSDGWVEQGGIQTTINQDTTTTITLLKPYKNALYNVVTQALATGSDNNSNNNGAEIYTKTTSTFIMYTYNYKKSVYWEAKGYIE